jgi:Fe-S cluster assembly scaffold protein SufB
MAMKSVKNANYWQVNHKIRNVSVQKGVIILTSPEAWKKFKWTRKWFDKKPKEGYFIWIKEQIDFPLRTCVSMASRNIQQSLQNLLVLEKNLNIKVQGTCNALTKTCSGTHKAVGKIILKQGSTLNYEHIHAWGKNDIIEPAYEFVLEKNAQLDYVYKNLLSPKQLKINTIFNAFENSKIKAKIIVNGINSKIDIADTIILKGKGSNGIIRLRLVGKKNSQVNAQSKIIAQVPSQGHLDCQGLLIDKNSQIKLSPELIIKDKNALITHEASVGKISEEQLNYLRTRGLSEAEAINLIVAGFLETK